jgi:hypothetical protein
MECLFASRGGSGHKLLVKLKKLALLKKNTIQIIQLNNKQNIELLLANTICTLKKIKNTNKLKNLYSKKKINKLTKYIQKSTKFLFEKKKTRTY